MIKENVEVCHCINVKDRIGVVTDGYWCLNSSQNIKEKEWHPINDEGYIVKIKQIIHDKEKAILVIRIKKRPGIIFSLVPDDIGFAIKLQTCKDSICKGSIYSEFPSCKTIEHINEYLRENYGEDANIENSELFRSIDSFEYKTIHSVTHYVPLESSDKDV